MASPKTGMGLSSVNMGRPMASMNDTARNSGGMMRSTKLESSAQAPACIAVRTKRVRDQGARGT